MPDYLILFAPGGLPAFPEWLEGPTSPWRRVLAVIVVGFFLVACVPLVIVFALAQAMLAILPELSPGQANALALANIILCAILEVLWFGGLVWGVVVLLR